MATVIGIGGVSNSGKSKLAGLIMSYYPNRKINIICQDDYVHPEYEIPRIKDHLDWESPESINFIAFKSAILEASKISEIVIVEGFLIYYDPGINKLFDNKIFIEIRKDTFLERKRKDLRWGEEPEWYMVHIWNSYLKIGKPKFQPKEFLSIDGSHKFDLNYIFTFLDLH